VGTIVELQNKLIQEGNQAVMEAWKAVVSEQMAIGQQISKNLTGIMKAAGGN
jgi:hypothetical protein